MPKSKAKRRRYQPPPRKKRKPSPRWFGPSILALMFVGVLVIVFNYLNLMPPWSPQPAGNLYLFVGLGLIALGFAASTQWR